MKLGSWGTNAGMHVRSGFGPKVVPAYGSCGGSRAVALTQRVIVRFPSSWYVYANLVQRAATMSLVMLRERKVVRNDIPLHAQ